MSSNSKAVSAVSAKFGYADAQAARGPAEFAIPALKAQSGFFLMRILRGLQESRRHEARRVIARYAHLLPEGVKAADIRSSIAFDQIHLGR